MPLGKTADFRALAPSWAFNPSDVETLISESMPGSCFLSGLKEEIQLAVRMFMPKTLSHTYLLPGQIGGTEDSGGQEESTFGETYGKSFQSFPKMEYFTGGSIVDSPRKTNGGNSEKASSHLERSGDG